MRLNRLTTNRNYSQHIAVINERMLDELHHDEMDFSDSSSVGIFSPPFAFAIPRVFESHELWSNVNSGLSITEEFARIRHVPEVTELKINEVFANTDNLSKEAIDVIGESGLQRFESFKQYTEGWDDGHGSPLSYRSTAVMEYFLHKFSNFYTKPSLFLTRNGNLQLDWEDKHGQMIEVEFFPDKIEFYIEASDDEGQITLQDVNKLISMLQAIN